MKIVILIKQWLEFIIGQERYLKKQQVEEKRFAKFRKNNISKYKEHEKFIESKNEIMENPFSNATKIINLKKNRAKLNRNKHRARLEVYDIIELNKIASLMKEYKKKKKKCMKKEIRQ